LPPPMIAIFIYLKIEGSRSKNLYFIVDLVYIPVRLMLNVKF
jgi:hypothetical protein